MTEKEVEKNHKFDEHVICLVHMIDASLVLHYIGLELDEKKDFHLIFKWKNNNKLTIFDLVAESDEFAIVVFFSASL